MLAVSHSRCSKMFCNELKMIESSHHIPSYPTSLPMASQSWWKLVQFSKCTKPCCSSASQAIAWNETRWGTSNENNPTGFPDIILYYIILYYITLYYMVSYQIISYHIILYHIILYHIILYYIISSYIISYHIILYIYIVCILNIYSQYSKNEDGWLNFKFHPPSASGLYRSVLSTLQRSWAVECSTECSDGPVRTNDGFLEFRWSKT